MDERCKNCSYTCKRLEADDEAVCYSFIKLSPEQVLTLSESVLNLHRCRHYIEVEETARSSGDQLAVLLRARYMPLTTSICDKYMTMIIRAESRQKCSTNVWFRYGIPQACCDQPHVVSEFSALANDVLNALSVNDSMLQAASWVPDEPVVEP